MKNCLYSITIIVVLSFLVSLVVLPISAVPTANFYGSNTTGPAPLIVTFTDTSIGSPSGWAWYFGDENYAASWTRITPGAGWSGRDGHASVVMPDGSIVLMGGAGSDGNKNDVWRSTNNGVTWTQMTPSAGWLARTQHSSVAMPDGSIVLMGGLGNNGQYKNDVWRSTDNGATWTQMTSSAGWSTRHCHSSVVMPDGSIVLMGGHVYDPTIAMNDVWRSTDNGATWTQMTPSAGWSARWYHSSVAMPDGSIVLMGGKTSGPNMDDVWRSTDNGATWTQMTPNAGWSDRFLHKSVVMPDGGIVLMGGNTGLWQNDVWRSKDNGATWTQVTPNAGWSARQAQSSMVMSDGSIVLMGGNDGSAWKNDVWRFVPTGSSAQNPSHTYSVPGTYQVALQAYNVGGYTSIRKTGYITVTTAVLTTSVTTSPATTMTTSTPIINQTTTLNVTATTTTAAATTIPTTFITTGQTTGLTTATTVPIVTEYTTPIPSPMTKVTTKSYTPWPTNTPTQPSPFGCEIVIIAVGLSGLLLAIKQ